VTVRLFDRQATRAMLTITAAAHVRLADAEGSLGRTCVSNPLGLAWKDSTLEDVSCLA